MGGMYSYRVMHCYTPDSSDLAKDSFISQVVFLRAVSRVQLHGRGGANESHLRHLLLGSWVCYLGVLGRTRPRVSGMATDGG